MDENRYLTFALAKGRLANKTLELLEEVGITCEEMKDKSSRKLIFVNEELKLKFFLSKGPDVPTYVEYGRRPISALWARIPCWRRADGYMKCWIWVSGNAVCASAGRQKPGSFSNITK